MADGAGSPAAAPVRGRRVLAAGRRDGWATTRRSPSGPSAAWCWPCSSARCVAGLLPAVERDRRPARRPARSANVLLDGFICGPGVRQQRQLHRRQYRPGQPAGRVLGRSCSASVLAGPAAAAATAAPAPGLRASPAPPCMPIYSPRPGAALPGPGSGAAPGAGRGPGDGPGSGPEQSARRQRTRQRHHELRQPARAAQCCGQCAPGRTAVAVPAGNMFNDNPQYSTAADRQRVQPGGLGQLQRAVPAGGAGQGEQPGHAGAGPDLPGHPHPADPRPARRRAPSARRYRPGPQSPTTVQRLINTAVVLTLIVAGLQPGRLGRRQPGGAQAAVHAAAGDRHPGLHAVPGRAAGGGAAAGGRDDRRGRPRLPRSRSSPSAGSRRRHCRCRCRAAPTS